MNFINHAEKTMFYDQQIDHIENEIRTLQATMPVEGGETIPTELAALLDDLFIQLHTVITLKCVTTIEPENTLIVDAIKHQQTLKVLDIGKLALLMSDQIELLHKALAQLDGDVPSTAMMKQTMAEFFIARQVLVDTAINDSSEADSFCQCSTCLAETCHQFTTAFDYVCTQCETPYFN